MLRKTVRLTIYLLLAGVVAVLVGVFMLYRNTPGWYRPLRLSQEQLEQASALLAGHIAQFQTEAMENPAGRPVVVQLSQEQANSYLQALPLYDPRIKLPADVVDPVIVFQKDRLILACRYPRLSNRPVSLHLDLRIEPDKVAVSIESIRLGSLPLPRQFISDQLAELRRRLSQAAARQPTNTKSARDRNMEMLIDLGQAFFQAVAAEPVPREFTARGSQRLIRVERVELAKGKLTLTFAPVGEPIPDPFPTAEQMHRGPTTRPDSD